MYDFDQVVSCTGSDLKVNDELVAAPRLLDEGKDVAADLAMVLTMSRSRRQMVQWMMRVLRLKEDNRLARIAIGYVQDTCEDPRVAYDDFLGLDRPVACDVRYFPARASGTAICDYLNAWTSSAELLMPKPAGMVVKRMDRYSLTLTPAPLLTDPYQRKWAASRRSSSPIAELA